MFRAEPRQDFGLQFAAKGDQFVGVGPGGATSVVVLHGVSFLATTIEVIRIALTVAAQHVRKRTERARVGELALRRLVAFGIK